MAGPKNIRSFPNSVWERSFSKLCFDASQSVAKAFTAACTPDPFLFDEKRLLVYRGRLDDSRPGNGKAPTGRDIRAAIEATLAGKRVAPVQRPSAGCNITWKPGNAPAYFSAHS